MEIPVIVIQDGNRYLARCVDPVRAEADGNSRFEAVNALAVALQAQLGVDVETLPLEVSVDGEWLASAGSIPDDELTRAWLREVAAYRDRQDLASFDHWESDAGTTTPLPGAEARP